MMITLKVNNSKHTWPASKNSHQSNFSSINPILLVLSEKQGNTSIIMESVVLLSTTLETDSWENAYKITVYIQISMSSVKSSPLVNFHIREPE